MKGIKWCTFCYISHNFHSILHSMACLFLPLRTMGKYPFSGVGHL